MAATGGEQGGVTHDARERLVATVRGRVQGVGFRWHVRRHAARLGLTGWTANMADGSLHVVAEGSPAALDELAGVLADGPPGAIVDRVDVQRVRATGDFGSFDIRASGHRGD